MTCRVCEHPISQHLEGKNCVADVFAVSWRYTCLCDKYEEEYDDL